jgi:hypothetical protein
MKNRTELTADPPFARSPLSFGVLFRSLALFVVLWQLRLLAGDLADTPVFIAAILCAFTAAIVLSLKKLKPLPACISLALIPWAARFFISVPRFFVTGPAAALDSLLLTLDRNNFVSLLPFDWTAASS